MNEDRQSRMAGVDASLFEGVKEVMLRPASSYCFGRRSVGRFVVVEFQFGLVAGMRPLTLRALKQLSRQRVKASCRKISISRENILRRGDESALI